MRDLGARLRSIVQNDARTTAARSYVADLGFHEAPNVETAAAALGGVVHRAHDGACVVVDRTWTPEQFHGRRRVESYALDPAAPIALFDPRLRDCVDWSSRAIFFDIETTGLSGGAGTVAFLVGAGWFERDGGFTTRQWLLNGPAGEVAMLTAIGRVMDEASLLVTYNGRTFDVPVMEMRWAFQRRESAATDLPHFDMLPPARRLWAGVKTSEVVFEGAMENDLRGRSGCSLTSLERSVLGFHRVGDVPGFEIPVRYFEFLRHGDAATLEGVMEHNRLDLISLAAVTSHALWLAQQGPDACRTATEQLGLGRLYERNGDAEKAAYAFERAAASADDRYTRRSALAHLAVLKRRDQRHDEAAAAWQHVLEDVAADPRRRGPLSRLERQAAEALAIHHEHRARNLTEAERYAKLLAQQSTPGVAKNDVAKRLGRLSRKMSAENDKGGPKAAPLLKD